MIFSVGHLQTLQLELEWEVLHLLYHNSSRESMQVFLLILKKK